MLYVSLIRDGKFSASLYSSFPTNLGKESTTVLQALIITLAVLFILEFLCHHIFYLVWSVLV